MTKKLFPVFAVLVVLAASGCAPKVGVEAERAAQPQAPSLDPRAPNSPGRLAVIEAFKQKASAITPLFEARTYTDSAGKTMPYRLFIPPEYRKDRRYPLVVYLHSAGGSGTDNIRQLQGANLFGSHVWGLPENQKRFPCFVVAPQSNLNWPNARIEPGKRPEILPGLGEGARLALEIIAHLQNEFPIDDCRICVTGFSMGGAGTWHMLGQRPELFASGVPVSGRADTKTASFIRHVPVWNFHGAADKVDPVSVSREMIQALIEAGGKPNHTEYFGVGHNAQEWAYTESALIEWVFAQDRCRREASSLKER